MAILAGPSASRLTRGSEHMRPRWYRGFLASLRITAKRLATPLVLIALGTSALAAPWSSGGGGSGGGGTSGTVNSGAGGQMAYYPGNGAAVSGSTVTGDCTFTAPATFTCTKSNGASFAASATTDTTNASNINSGTLGAARMPLGMTATPSAGQIHVGNAGGTAFANQTVGGDATLSSAGALTVTKTNGTSFAPSATTDTTNASNITSGTLGTGRLPTVPVGNGGTNATAAGATAANNIGALAQASNLGDLTSISSALTNLQIPSDAAGFQPLVMASSPACGAQPCGGTVLNELAKVVILGASLQTVDLQTTNHAIDTGADCVVTAGAGTGGSTTCHRQGNFTVMFDAASATAGDCVDPSTTTDGNVHDIGSATCDANSVGRVVGGQTLTSCNIGSGCIVHFRITPPTGLLFTKLATTVSQTLPAGAFGIANNNTATVGPSPRWWGASACLFSGDIDFQNNGTAAPTAINAQGVISGNADSHDIPVSEIPAGVSAIYSHAFVFGLAFNDAAAAPPFQSAATTVNIKVNPTTNSVIIPSTGAGDGMQVLCWCYPVPR